MMGFAGQGFVKFSRFLRRVWAGIRRDVLEAEACRSRFDTCDSGGVGTDRVRAVVILASPQTQQPNSTKLRLVVMIEAGAALVELAQAGGEEAKAPAGKR